MQFVLVHGGWQGGWCWEAVAPIRRQAGHDDVLPVELVTQSTARS